MKGFTLIELLVVVLIIGILSAVALPQYQKAVNKSRTVNMLTLLRSLKDAEERHYMSTGEYTTDWESLDVALPSSCTVNGINARCNINGQNVKYTLSAGSFSHPNYYVVRVMQESPFYIAWQWQLDHASIVPGKRICFPHESSSQALDLCKGFGGVACGAYAGWYPGLSQPYCLPD